MVKGERWLGIRGYGYGLWDVSYGLPIQSNSNSSHKGEGSIWSSFKPLTMNHLDGPNNGSPKSRVQETNSVSLTTCLLKP